MMEWRSLLFVAGALVAVAVARPEDTSSVPTIDKLCVPEVCNCTAEEIVCKCTKNEKLEVKKDYIADKTAVLKFEIQDCSSLIISEDALTNAHKLKSLQITNVKEVDLKEQKEAFQDLQSVWIDKVPSLKLSKGVFTGAKNLDSIRIRESTIHELHEGDLLAKVKYLEFNSLLLQKVGKGAITIEGINENSTINVLKSKIKNIENMGIEILKFTNFSLENCEFSTAAKSSIILKELGSFEVRGNTFQPDVDVESIEVSSKSIMFVNNKLLNIDTSKDIKYKTKENETSLSLESIIMNHDGNMVNCKCGTGLELTGKFGNNLCVSETCKNITLEKFMQSCKKSPGKKDEEILKSLCLPIQEERVHGVSITTQNPVQTSEQTMTQKPIPQHDSLPDAKTRSHGSKITAGVLPIFVVYLCHLIMY